MERINTTINVDYFFKWFSWKDNHSIGFALTNSCFYHYESDDSTQEPILKEVLPLTRKQVKQIKQYLFSYKDIARKCDNYIWCGIEPFRYELKGYFKNKFVHKKVVGDSASPKIQDIIFRIINNEVITPADYI